MKGLEKPVDLVVKDEFRAEGAPWERVAETQKKMKELVP
jgi:hypothetical protein